MKPSFDTWTIIFLFAAIQGIFVSAVLLFKKEKHPSRKILAVISFLFSVILIEYTLFWTHYDYYFPWLIGWAPCFIFLFGPLFYLYFRNVFGGKYFRKKDLFHLIVFAIAVIFSSSLLFASLEWKQDLLAKKQTLGISYYYLIDWIGIAHMSIYLFFNFRDFYALSRTEPEVKNWFRWVNGFFAAFILSYLSYFILSKFSFFNPSWDYAISFSMMFFIYFLAWFGYMQPKVFSGFNLFESRINDSVANTETKKYKNSPVSSMVGAELAEKINEIMDQKKLYLESDISLDTLARSCGFSKHHISQVINENMKMNFFEYINSLRINEAKELLTRPKEELTIIEIAYQVGYNNKVSFNKAFKNITGVTPTEYRAKELIV